MSVEEIKTAIKEKKLVCPQCSKPVKEFDKHVQMTVDVWDGFGDSRLGTGGDKVTLICGNDDCSWKERTEYWQNYLES